MPSVLSSTSVTKASADSEAKSRVNGCSTSAAKLSNDRMRAFIGGGARSALWCQTLADVLGCTIHQAEDPVLANARGAAIIAAVGIGALDWADVPALARTAESYRPDPARRAVYDRQFRTFTDLYRKNRRLYARHNRPQRGAPRAGG